jgi:predicted nucleic acid-binding protein
MSQPGYPNHFSCADVADHLRMATETRHHEFWPDSLSILDQQLIDWQLLVGPKQLTDIYLLALAAKNGGRFVTFDKKITASLVIGAGSEHYEVI